MRAPDDAPPAIKAALAVSDEEKQAYPLREGAFYGNIFATTPLNPAVSGFTGPSEGAVVNTPTFKACAGPGSNIPGVTRRFCSSQGAWGPIDVTGICTNVCDGIGDADYGAMRGCHAGATTYNEVITVYLKKPIAVCGNAVCEDTGEPTSPETSTTCPSDCHPGSWGKKLPDFGSSSAVAPDGSIVVAAVVYGDIDLGGGVLKFPGPYRDVVVAKYNPDGSYAWGKRIPASLVVGGTALNVLADGSIVVGAARGFSLTDTVWLAKLTPNRWRGHRWE
jgi:hypothetical protein